MIMIVHPLFFFRKSLRQDPGACLGNASHGRLLLVMYGRTGPGHFYFGMADYTAALRLMV